MLFRSGGAPDRQHVAIVTGLSGAGKTATSKIFEDLGYTVIDNVPSDLLRNLAELVADEPARYRRVALVLDVRSGNAPVCAITPVATQATAASNTCLNMSTVSQVGAGWARRCGL